MPTDKVIMRFLKWCLGFMPVVSNRVHLQPLF